MEAKYEYQVFDEERKKKVQGIEGLTDLMEAIVCKETAERIADLEKQYPRAAAYLKAQDWKWSPNMKQSVLGTAAAYRILEGDDPAVVLEEMESSWNAFQVAQGG